MYKSAVIIPTMESRLENLVETIKYLSKQTKEIEVVTIVCDGFNSGLVINALIDSDNHNPATMNGIKKIKVLEAPKHVAGSGTLQPKNYGAAWVDRAMPEVTHYWFLDSDVITTPTTNAAYANAAALDEDEPRILIGRYEWLPAGKREIVHELSNDPRNAMFRDYGPEYTSVGEINFALANFGGNIVYPAEAFRRVGGFWDDLSAGRVEDGEMGLRCASMGIPMTVVPQARGFHLDHPVNHQHKLEVNKKEVPMINARHPWVEDEGLIVVEEDGKRFDWINPDTGEQVNTLEIWNHKRERVNE